MIRQLLLAFRLASYLAALIPLVVPNTLIAGAGFSGAAYSSLSLSELSETTAQETTRVPEGTRCSCKKIAPGLCFLDPSCGVAIAGKPVWSRKPLPYSYFPASPSPQHIPLKILETGYSLLMDIGGEESGYGLYSYALMVNYNSRSAKFLSDVFSEIPRVEDTAAQRSQTSIFYIPIRKDKVNEFPEAGNEYGKFFVSHAKDFYDYKMARAILDHMCDVPAEEIKAVCEGDLSRGPYIFSYAKPASKVTPVPPPFLFMDLSDVHERAFPEIIAAFKAQVKRDDISDRAKIDTLRLKLLSIVLTAADFVAPVQKATADMVHIAGPPQAHSYPPAPAPPPRPRPPPSVDAVPTGAAPRILGTGYSLLNEIGGEEPGYGLYSYALVVDDGHRSTEFVKDVFSDIRPVGGLPTQRSQLNLLSIPLKIYKTAEMIELLERDEAWLNRQGIPN